MAVTAFAVFVLAAVVVGLDLAFAVVMSTSARMLDIPWLEQGAILWLILVFWVLPKDWLAINRVTRITGSSVINAPLSEVWEAVRVSPREGSYRSVVARITPDFDKPDRFYFHLDDRVSDPDASSRLTVDVVQEEPEAYLKLTYPKTDMMPGISRDVAASEIYLETTPDGVRVTFVETVNRLAIATIFTLFFIHPCQDSARRLKAWVEGSTDVSMVGGFMTKVGPTGELSADMRINVLLATLTAAFMAGMIVLGIFRLVWHMMPTA